MPCCVKLHNGGGKPTRLRYFISQLHSADRVTFRGIKREKSERGVKRKEEKKKTFHGKTEKEPERREKGEMPTIVGVKMREVCPISKLSEW